MPSVGAGNNLTLAFTTWQRIGSKCQWIRTLFNFQQKKLGVLEKFMDSIQFYDTEKQTVNLQ